MVNRNPANEFAVARMEARLDQRLAEFGAELRGEIQTLRTEIHAMKAELIKWTFLCWAGTALAGLLTR
jgi:hypothetical protein